MPNQMTPERLGEIEARANAATRGPWEQDRWEVLDSDGFVLVEHDSCEFIRIEDADFIAHAREDLPALVSALREAWGARDAALLRAEQAEGEVARLREVVSEMRTIITRNVSPVNCRQSCSVECPDAKREKCCWYFLHKRGKDIDLALQPPAPPPDAQGEDHE